MTPQSIPPGGRAWRRWASWTLLLGVSTLAVLVLGSGALALARGAGGAAGGLLDLRAFAPVSPSRPIAAAKKSASAEAEGVDVRLTVWENTDDRRSMR